MIIGIANVHCFQLKETLLKTLLANFTIKIIIKKIEFYF